MGNNISLIEKIKTFVGIIAQITTIFAIIIGGVWTYKLFIEKRQNYPRAHIKHSVTYTPITKDKMLLHVAVNILNKGDILLALESGEVRIQQIMPLKPKHMASISKGEDLVKEGQIEVLWPLLAKRKWKPEKSNTLEIEPNESDELHFDFILPSNAQTIEVYSYFKNVSKKDEREIGWNLTTLYDLTSNNKKKALSKSIKPINNKVTIKDIKNETQVGPIILLAEKSVQESPAGVKPIRPINPSPNSPSQFKSEPEPPQQGPSKPEPEPSEKQKEIKPMPSKD